MGAPSQPERYWLGGRWTAALSLWTYFHRLLHMLGILSIDREERSLLEGHAVRIRHERTGRALAHSASLTRGGCGDALSLSPRSAENDVDSLFFVHFTEDEASEDADDLSSADVLQIATARPPRAWLAKPQNGDGPLVLAHNRSSGARFSISSAGGQSVSFRALPAGVSAGSKDRPVLSIGSEGARGTPAIIGLSQGQVGARSRFSLNVVPLKESALLVPVSDDAIQPPGHDPTVGSVLTLPRSTAVRMQCVRGGALLAALPGERMRVARAGDEGWDVFSFDYDVRTCTAVLRDTQGTPLCFSEDHEGLVAKGNDSRGERFTVEEVDRLDGGGDDRVTLRSRKGYLSVIRRGDVRLERERKPTKTEMFWLRLALPSMMDRSKPRRRLRRLAGGIRCIEATIEVPVEAGLGYEVLTDYDGFSNFIQDAAESEILERHDDGRLTVRMVQSHTFLVLTLNLGMQLNVTECPAEGHVTMEMTRGFGVREYRGTWTSISSGDDRCVLSCELHAAPAIPAPAFLIDGVMMHATCTTLEQLRVECMRRAAARRGAVLRNGRGRVSR